MLYPMHGEYKVPGGKLVVVDLEVRDGRIADFHLAGDFFLEPDERARRHRRAPSNGLPVEDRMSQPSPPRSRAALPEGAQLLGFTPEAVGTAVRRALVTAPGLARLRLGDRARAGRCSPRMNLALDEVLTDPRRRRPSPADAAAVGVGRVGRRDRHRSSRCATRSTPRAPSATASTSCAASRAAAR